MISHLHTDVDEAELEAWERGGHLPAAGGADQGPGLRQAHVVHADQGRRQLRRLA